LWHFKFKVTVRVEEAGLIYRKIATNVVPDVTILEENVAWTTPCMLSNA